METCYRPKIVARSGHYQWWKHDTGSCFRWALYKCGAETPYFVDYDRHAREYVLCGAGMVPPKWPAVHAHAATLGFFPTVKEAQAAAITRADNDTHADKSVATDCGDKSCNGHGKGQERTKQWH